MHLSQSVVLWQGRSGIQKKPYLVKDQVHIMARTAQISKDKQQSVITLRHEGQSIRKISRTLNFSSSAKTIKSKNHQALWWNWLSWGPPQERKTEFIRVNCTSHCSPNKCFTEFKSPTHLNINCSEETAWIRPSWSNCCEESTGLRNTSNGH